MKSKALILLLFAFSAMSYSQSLDSAKAFYPLQVGNNWLYQYEFRVTNPPSRVYYYTAQIIGDTLMQNGMRYFTFVRTNLSNQGSTKSFERVDSVTANLYSWDSALAKDNLIDSLRAQGGDLSGKWACFGNSTLTLFGSATLAKGFGVTGGTHSYAYGYGYAYSFDEVSGFPYGYSLLYARINGIEHGTPLAVEEVQTTLLQFQLYQNFPNPFNPVTQIRFSLEARSHVTLKVFSILGQEIATLLDETKSAGEHQIEFKGANLASGVYLYRLSANNRVLSKLMMLLK